MEIWGPGGQGARGSVGCPLCHLGAGVEKIFLGYIRNWSESSFPGKLWGLGIAALLSKLNCLLGKPAKKWSTQQ